MRVLFDAYVPRPLRKHLTDHSVQTAQEMGWSRLKNGALLREAEAQFDALITTDRNLKFQQSLIERKLGILALPTNDWRRIRSRTDEIASTLTMLRPGDLVELNWD